MVPPLALSFARSLRSHCLLTASVGGPRPHRSVAAAKVQGGVGTCVRFLGLTGGLLELISYAV